MLNKYRALLLIAAWVLLACGASAQTVVDPAIQVADHVPGLSAPTGMRFLGTATDSLFAIEKNTGQVQWFHEGELSTVLDLNVNTVSERGLLGIEIDPDFAENGFVYLYYSRSTIDGDSDVVEEWSENRVSRFTWNGASLTSENPLLSFPSSTTQANGANHNGGPLAFGPDGKLYGITGDLNRDRAEQNNQGAADLSSGAGGIFRIEPNGSIPTDNPFVANSNADFHRWYAYGVRNSFGLAFDPLTGQLWDTENGPDAYDEINRAQPGFNSGWNSIMGPDARNVGDLDDLVELPGSSYSDPEFSWLSPVAVTSIEFLAESSFDWKYRDTVVVGDANTGRLYQFKLNESRDGFVLQTPGLTDLVADGADSQSEITFGNGFGVTTDIRRGPDGALYVTSLSEGKIFRLAPLTPWQNARDAVDVNDDLSLEPQDALIVINDLNDVGARSLVVPPPQGEGPPPFVDVNGDNFVTPQDALIVINAINERNAEMSAEGAELLSAEGGGTMLAAAAVAEPSTGVLAAMALVGLILLRARRPEA